jgi:ABC-type enterochelin transport system substrate-binding protein
VQNKFTELAGKRSTYNRERYQALSEAKQSLISVQDREQEFSQTLQQQTEETATLLSQQAQQLQLKTQSAQLNSMSQEIAETAKIKKTLLHQIWF